MGAATKRRWTPGGRRVNLAVQGGVGALAFLLGRASAGSALLPFALPFVAAVAEHWPSCQWVASAAALAGAWTAGGARSAGELAAALLALFWLCRLSSVPSRTWVGLCAAAEQLVTAGGPPDPWSAAFAAIRGFFAALLAVAFSRAIARDGSGAPEGQAYRALLAGCAGAGLGHGTFAAVDAWVVWAVATMLLAARSGPAAGSGAGLAVGAIGLAAGVAASDRVALLGLGGFVAGLFAPWGAAGEVAGFALSLGWLVVSAGGQLPTMPTLVGSAAGSLVFLATPERWRRRLWPVEAAPTGPRAVDRLGQLAEALAELARAFRESAAAAQEPRLPEPGVPADELVGSVCTGCPSFNACWQRDYIKAYKMVGDLLALAEMRPVRPTDVGSPETIRCLRPGEMARAANWKARIAARERQWAIRVEESRAVMVGQLEGVAQALAEAVQGMVGERQGVDEPPLRYEIGVASACRPNRLASGDSHVVRELPGNRLLLALSDGMGSGARAAALSSTTLQLLERLVEVGFRSESAVRTVNAVLLLRGLDEAFATVDVVLVDLVRRQAELVKAGAAPGVLRRGGEVRLLHTPSVPAGVLPDAEVQAIHLPLVPGDELVLVTDGVLDARRRGGERVAWLRAAVAQGDRLSSDARARSILEQALQSAAGEEHDDMTVLVCRLLAP